MIYFHQHYQWIRFGRDFSRGRPRDVWACSRATHSRTKTTTHVNLKIQIDHFYIYFRRKNRYICLFFLRLYYGYTLPLGSSCFLHESQRSRKSLIFHHYAWSSRNYHQGRHLSASAKTNLTLSIPIDMERRVGWKVSRQKRSVTYQSYSNFLELF